MAVLRLELAGEPIRVLEIAPGLVKTPEFSLKRFKGDRKQYDEVYEGVVDPLTAEDIALTIAQAIEMPQHINLDLIFMRPVAQASYTKLIRRPLEPKQPE